MIKRIVLVLGGIVFSLVLFVCSENPTIPEPTALESLQERLAQTPRLNREAEEMALWLSQELVAPESLYQRLDTAVHRLRNQFVPKIPSIDEIHYYLSPRPSAINIVFDSSVAKEMRNGSYSDWDSLNSLFGAQVVDTVELVYEGGFWVAMRFAGRLSSDSLEHYYEQLPGVQYAYSVGGLLDGSRLYPYLESGELRFLLRNAWGDCYNGCIINAFTYFREEADTFQLVGQYFRAPDEEVPDWWTYEACPIWCWHLIGKPCGPDYCGTFPPENRRHDTEVCDD